MPKDGDDSDGLGKAYLTNADESQIRTECFIPSYIKIQFDREKSGSMVCSDTHKVCLYKAMFKAKF